MKNILKITLVAFAVLSGASAAYAEHPDCSPSESQKILKPFTIHGG